MLEYPKTQGANQATILVDEAKAEMGNQQITPQYIAGIWDGEGTISITQHPTKGSIQFRSTVCMANTDLRIIMAVKRYAQSLGCGVYIRESNRTNRGKNSKIQYQLTITSLKSRLILLNSIVPYLIGKKDQAEIVIEFIKSRLSKTTVKRDWKGRYKGMPGFNKRESELHKVVKSLNQRGISETICHPPYGDEIVRSALRDAEQGRNDLARQLQLFS